MTEELLSNPDLAAMFSRSTRDEGLTMQTKSKAKLGRYDRKADLISELARQGFELTERDDVWQCGDRLAFIRVEMGGLRFFYTVRFETRTAAVMH